MLRCRILEPVITDPYRLSALLVPKGAAAVHFCRHSRPFSCRCVGGVCVYEYTVVSVAVPNILLYVPAWPAKVAPLFTPAFSRPFLPPRRRHQDGAARRTTPEAT